MSPWPFKELMEKKVEAYREQQRHNPTEWEKVEGNLRMTKIRRIIPIQSHYYSTHQTDGGHHARRGE